MRIVLIGVSHWHTPFYSEPVLAMPDATIVGVSDPDAARAAPLAGKAKCPVFTDYREMCVKLKPDFAYAHYYAGQVYQKQRNVAKASEHYQYFLQLAPVSPDRTAIQAIMRSLRG
jgi:tetratricopeptide (TPR) repeat protein